MYENVLTFIKILAVLLSGVDVMFNLENYYLKTEKLFYSLIISPPISIVLDIVYFAIIYYIVAIFSKLFYTTEHIFIMALTVYVIMLFVTTISAIKRYINHSNIKEE